jgi:hypothetical protein
MFHKGKRRRRFIAFTQAEPGASSSDGLSELARIAASFEPVRYELDDRQLAAFPDRDEPRGLKPAGDEDFSFWLLPVGNQILPGTEDSNASRFSSASDSRKD